MCVSSPWEGSVSRRLRGLRVTHCPPRHINREQEPGGTQSRAAGTRHCHRRTMALVLLAPLAVGLLALSCCAAPLQNKPQAVVTFPGELVSSTLSDLELAEVRGAQPHGPLPAPKTLRGSRDGSVGLQAELRGCPSPCTPGGARAGIGHQGCAVARTARAPSCLAQPLRLPFLPRATCCVSATPRRRRQGQAASTCP